MIEPKPHPTRLLHWMAGLARWSLRLVLAFWLVLGAAWGVLHGWIVPRIGDWRPQLESVASQALGTPVRIGSISAHGEGPVPSFELRDVVLQDPKLGTDALRLSRVVVAVSARSLLRLGVEQIYIDQPQLSVRRTTDGRIHVAGLEIQPQQDSSSSLSNWLFSQSELALRHGTLEWHDELRQAPVLRLSDVDLVIRNRGRKHQLRLDATPPPAWGKRLTAMGVFRQPLLSTQKGQWQRWSGQAYVQTAGLDLAVLPTYLDTGDWTLQQGHGALRAWVDVRQGQAIGALADVALTDFQIQAQPDMPALALQQLQGRLSAQHLDSYQWQAQDLAFRTEDGQQWPASQLRLDYTPVGTRQQGPLSEQGQASVDHADLGMLAYLAQRLPLPATLREQIQALEPQGQVKQLQWSWRGPWQSMPQYRASGQVHNLSLAAQAAAEDGPHADRPGVQGLDIQFKLDQDSGQAQLSMDGQANEASLSFPGIFEAPRIGLDHMSATAHWKIQAGAVTLQVPTLRFGNADAQGEARLSWRTGTEDQARFPGVLDLQGSLHDADGTQVHRYLPLEIPADARHYVRDAIVAGRASVVDFKVRGDLRHLPFNQPEQGTFHIAAKLHDVSYDYVPPRLLAAGEAPWPALAGLSGDLVFDRASMSVRNAQGQFAHQARIALRDLQASVPDLEHPVVQVNAKGSGPLADMLAVVQRSAVSALTGHVLDHSQASGNAQLALQLHLPVDHLDQSRVQGSVTLAGNHLRLTPETPALSQLQGSVKFSETGFSLGGIQGRALGGELRLDGGMQTLAAHAPASESAVLIRAQGTATAQGLREAKELGPVADLARHAQGQSAYSLQLKVRRGMPEIQVSTQLQGMALGLPAPLNKAAASALALRYHHQVAPSSLAHEQAPLHDQISLQVGTLGSVLYERDASGPQPVVLRGAIAVGLPAETPAPSPAHGVQAHVQLPALDLDSWLTWLQAGPGTSDSSATPEQDAVSRAYLPQYIGLQVGELQLKGRQLHHLVAGISREGSAWLGNVSAQELDGYLEFREGSAAEPAGQFTANLSRLALPDSTHMDALLSEEPRDLPALQILVQDMQLAGRRLGRLEVLAHNRGGEDGRSAREWQLARFDITTPEATLTAHGSWALQRGPTRQAERRTELQFQLQLRNVGQLLERFSMPGVVRNGKGLLQGNVSWLGSPMTPDFRKLSGQLNLDVGSGQFLQAEPGLAKLLGVLSLQALPRRLTLDFRDVFSQGFSFDFMRGDVKIAQGVASTNNMQMKGVNAAVLMEGSADLVHETQKLHVVVVPEINAMTASLVATAINPVVGLGSFLAQVLLRGPLIAAATKEFRIDGSWSDPQVTALPRRRTEPTPDPKAEPAEASSPSPAPSPGETP